MFWMLWTVSQFRALEEPRNASAAERDRVFLEESGFPSDND